MVYILSSSQDFQEKVLQSSTPVLVDFFASWCGPCQMLMPVLNEVSLELGEKCPVYKIDIDLHSDLAKKYRVMSIPILKVFVQGAVVAESLGLKSKADLIAMVQPFLKVQK